MSYGVAAALQQAVFERLRGDAALEALVGGAIYDAVPNGAVPPLYVTLGPEDARARGDGTAAGAWHRLTVTVVSEAAVQFWRARARRETRGSRRRIDLTFRARVDDGT